MKPTMYRLGALALAIGLSASGGARAATVIETENNNTFATANQGLSGTHEYHADLAPLQDVDFWRFNLAAGTIFSVDSLVMYQVYTGVLDIQLVLFNSAGQSVASNNGDLGNFSSSDLFSYNVADAGTYYLTVSGYQNVPLDAFGNNLGDADGFWYEGTTFDHWSEQSFGTGHYGLQITAVPEADTTAMLLAGLGLVGWAARRRQRAI